MKEETHNRLVTIACEYLEKNYEDLAHDYRHNRSDFWIDIYDKTALLNRLKNNKEDLHWVITEIYPYFFNFWSENDEDADGRMFDSTGTMLKNVYKLENMYFIIDSDTYELLEVELQSVPIIIYKTNYKIIE